MSSPTKKPESILIVEDEPEVRSYLELSLRCHGYTVHNVEDGEEALQFLDRHGDNGPSLVLLDVVMPRKDGLVTLQQLRRSHKELPVVMLSGASSTHTIVEAMKAGANDFLTKPIGHTELAAAIQKVLAAQPRHNGGAHERLSPPPDSPLGGVSGTWLRKIEPFLRQVGASDAPVLIQGETGAGKEVLARLLHTYSPRANRPFLKLNCAALPSELVESELFGFEKGAFTGAFKNKPGKFDLADTGTLLLDEIGDMDFKLQAKLLQVLQEQQFERLGGRETVRVNVRVMAATHCDLEKAIAAGRFREDLYHRLNVIGLEVPPLRERLDEIPALCEFFLAKHAPPKSDLPQITPALMDALMSYQWPGNVRELENFMRKHLILRNPEMLIAELRARTETRSRAFSLASHPVSMPVNGARQASLAKVEEVQRQLEIEAIMNALNKTRWNRKQAATLLGIDYKALLYKMKKLGIEGKNSPSSGAARAKSQVVELPHPSAQPPALF